MNQHVFKNKSLLSASGLQWEKQGVKGVQIAEIKLNVCEDETAFTVFGFKITGKQATSGLLPCSLQPLFSSLMAPPTLLIFLVQNGSAVCPVTTEATVCSEDECRHLYGTLPPRRASSGKKNNKT